MPDEPDSSPPLLELLAGANPEERFTLQREDLLELFALVAGGDADVVEGMEISVLATIAGSQPTDAFGLRVGQWRVDVRTRVAQSAVGAALLGGVMAVTDVSSPAVALLALVLPFLLDVDTVDVLTRDRIVRAHLTDPALLDDPEAAYAALPDDLRAQLTLLEFADVLDRLRAAKEPPDGDAVALPLNPPAEPPSSEPVD